MRAPFSVKRKPLAGFWDDVGDVVTGTAHVALETGRAAKAVANLDFDKVYDKATSIYDTVESGYNAVTGNNSSPEQKATEDRKAEIARLQASYIQRPFDYAGRSLPYPSASAYLDGHSGDDNYHAYDPRLLSEQYRGYYGFDDKGNWVMDPFLTKATSNKAIIKGKNDSSIGLIALGGGALLLLKFLL